MFVCFMLWQFLSLFTGQSHYIYMYGIFQTRLVQITGFLNGLLSSKETQLKA